MNEIVWDNGWDVKTVRFLVGLYVSNVTAVTLYYNAVTWFATDAQPVFISESEFVWRITRYQHINDFLNSKLWKLVNGGIK